MITIEIPDSIEIFNLDTSSLPDDWKSFPHSEITQEIGESFISKREFLVVKVPSVVVQGDYNYLINPSHQDFDKIKRHNAEGLLFTIFDF